MDTVRTSSITTILSALWLNADIETLETAGQKYVLLSDIHLGDGGRADDSRNNEQALVDALRHYAGAGYTLLLLGDIEEFWQFDLEAVVGALQRLRLRCAQGVRGPENAPDLRQSRP